VEKFTRLSSADRRDILQEAANIQDMNPAVIEKDFWVCWVLGRIFSHEPLKDSLVFKGGTSLSKAFGLIERFSEDIDMVLDWRLLGYSDQLEEEARGLSSKTKQDRFNKEVNAKAAAFIGTELLDTLRRLLGKVAGIRCAINPADPQTVNVTYPAAFSEQYLRPEIWLEIGPLASFVPSSWRSIVPYAAQALPEFFGNSSADVVAIQPERTFWEKATILHQQAHRSGAMPARYSRHYYDLFKLAASPARHVALANPTLLREVVTFKQRFYPSAWARYDLACPGTLRLLPPDAHRRELAKDYREMKVMIFGETPSFEAILESLTALEAEINNTATIKAAR